MRLKLFLGSLLFLFYSTYSVCAEQAFIYTDASFEQNLHDVGQILAARDNRFPQSAADIKRWRASKRPQSRISSIGGGYWLIVDIENQSDIEDLVLYPYNTLVSKIESRIYDLTDVSQPVRSFVTGGVEKNQFAFHYGNRLNLEKGKRYTLITHFESDYFYTPAKLILTPYQDYFEIITLENVIIMLCFGVGIALGLYNLLIYLVSKDVTHLYYALFTASWVFAWSHFFHISDQLFGYYNPHLHWLGFALTPLTNILFYNNLLKLKETFPKLSQLSLTVGVIATLGIPFCVVWPSFGFYWSTLVTGVALCLGLYIGVRCMLIGFKPARYFVLAYVAMMVPNMVGNLTNLGLLPATSMNLYLLGLIGTAMDAMLLAFAVADKFRLLHEDNVELNKNLEQKVQLRTLELEELADELRDANEAKSRFLANISHEIRTPMTSIIGYADGIMLGDIKPHERNHGIGVILQNSRHVLGLINDILDMSKIEANKLEIDLIETDLFATIANIESLIGKQIRDKGLKFSVDYQFPLPDYIVTDPSRLRQILLNLTTNALKFTQVGRITLTVSCENNTLAISVKDTGIGMTDSEQKSLFSAFYQADSSISRQYGGTGLGLNISKSLALKLDGDISVKSYVGSGSEFTLTIAVYTTDNTRWLNDMSEVRLVETSPFSKLDAPENLKGRVLLAEDHPDNRRLFARILERMGLTVTTVENGKDAVQQTLENTFDLILLDIQMPIMDGQEALKMMHATGISVPIIALTANTMKHEVERYMNQGFTDLIAKPIDRNAFSHKIASYLDCDELADIKLPEHEFQLLKDDYIKGLKNQYADMRKQYKKMDIEGLSRNVHMLKGAANMFECETLYIKALAVDSALKNDTVTLDTQLFASLFKAMEDEIDKVCH
ncbi:histidine kinase [Pseudoalteromonas lipolytica SCSIO 04301]|uniref:7TM diverse intracellular signaling domain-containing protein n=1 Tax=Pseudoalteromonas lipolytica TaxID=570156 RepID=UPI0004532F46|nr:7TM diverse intracellular signaling domain-containing protein [Pseudoalteromonas lipolytica]EWH07350.1 histidine kinase [Pseudoalteromonas lipolytica SCSIO 04301]